MIDLDELLFVRGGWFALGAGNERVPGVVVPSLQEGLRLVGQGPVRAVVGRLRPEVRVVDVDVADARGDAAVELVAGWCRDRGLWHLVRPSGGGPGRAHVFVATGDDGEALSSHVGHLREQLRTSRRGLDVRDTVRPLSSPHRSGVATRPYGNLSEALRGLRVHSWASSAPARALRRSQSRVSTTPAVPVRRRPRKDVPEQWRAYLEHGVMPLIRTDEPDRRSNYEATATAVLLRCGYDAASAWALIAQAHPAAFGKARQQGQAWWVKYVWNPAVADDDTFIPAGVGEPDAQLLASLAGAREALTALAWRQPGRQRSALLLVGHAVLARMERVGSRRVPVPERDLVLDTGLSDRKTIRAQLRLLNGAMGCLHTQTWDPVRRRDSSSFEFEIPQAEGVREIPPPSLHTPLPHGLWGSLPRSSHQLWQGLRQSLDPVTLEEAAAAGLLLDSPGLPASPSQIRAARRGLLALSQAGLATCDAAGLWRASTRLDRDFVETVRVEHAQREAVVAAERDAYRTGRGSPWSVQRAAALKAQRAREVAWWEGLGPAVRVQRRGELASRFQNSSVAEQERFKAQSVDRRLRRGVDEVARHRAWLAGLPDTELAWRSITRSIAFAAQPSPVQQALVASWDRHRDRYGLPHRVESALARVEQHELLPVGADARDQDFWEQQSLPVAAGGDRRRHA